MKGIYNLQCSVAFLDFLSQALSKYFYFAQDLCRLFPQNLCPTSTLQIPVVGISIKLAYMPVTTPVRKFSCPFCECVSCMCVLMSKIRWWMCVWRHFCSCDLPPDVSRPRGEVPPRLSGRECFQRRHRCWPQDSWEINSVVLGPCLQEVIEEGESAIQIMS